MHAINVFLNICKEAITKVDKNLVETLATQNKEPEEIEKLASPREMLEMLGRENLPPFWLGNNLKPNIAPSDTPGERFVNHS